LPKRVADLGVEVLYEDVGRINAEGRLPDLKGTVQEWCDKARERRPAILILDGLDALLCPENEVSI
jgi:hypothetical protein